MRFYFAYGPHLLRAFMEQHCPGARPHSAYDMRSWRLVLAGLPTIRQDVTATTPGALYAVCGRCVDILDTYHALGYTYDRVVVSTRDGPALVYTRRQGVTTRPVSAAEVRAMREGYREWGLNEKWLNAALRHAGWRIRE